MAAILKFKMEALSYTIPIAITLICYKEIISLLKNMVRLCPSTGNENLVWLMHYDTSLQFKRVGGCRGAICWNDDFVNIGPNIIPLSEAHYVAK